MQIKSPTIKITTLLLIAVTSIPSGFIGSYLSNHYRAAHPMTMTAAIDDKPSLPSFTN